MTYHQQEETAKGFKEQSFVGSIFLVTFWFTSSVLKKKIICYFIAFTKRGTQFSINTSGGNYWFDLVCLLYHGAQRVEHPGQRH